MSGSPSTGPETGTEERTGTRTQRGSDTQKWLSGIVSLIGLWIAVSPFIYTTTDAATWNNVLVGGAIFLLAGYNYYRIVSAEPTSMGVMSLVALLGLWILVSPFVLEGQVAIEGLEIAEGMVWSNVVSGILAAGISAYVAYAADRGVPTGTAAETR